MRAFLYLFLVAACLACSAPPANRQAGSQTDADDDGWRPLFDGTSLTGWHVYNKGDVSSKWTATQGVLVCDPKKADGIFGDLVTDSSYANFEMELEWRISKGGNSGIFINVQESPAYAATFATGLEMQLLDNAYAEHRHQIDSTHWAGCLYAVDCFGKNSAPTPHGEWNKSRIVQQDGKVSFWLNGKLTFEAETKTEAFKNKVSSTSMKAYPDFGKQASGKIALQNHTDSVSFRNIRIRTL
ncbi:3-keto-disaccharide hydrolase [Sphingobacterium suaedae]|uniref:DUF1080 domain-containing protein n=1 Tax=Sphingobacterium suaedae TaxID=1686402 RepID=A0ABW5KQE8_9SPHI